MIAIITVIIITIITIIIIRMGFGTSKCAILIMEGGPISRREDIQL